jgi:hypothetical protein
MKLKLIETSVIYQILYISFTLYFRRKSIPNHINHARKIKMVPNCHIGDHTHLENQLLLNLKIYCNHSTHYFHFKKKN